MSMSGGRIDLTAPIMSVRRIPPMKFEEQHLESSHVTVAKKSQSDREPGVSCNPVTAAAIPFVWEQMPGVSKSKQEDSSTFYSDSKFHSYAPPPGRVHGVQFSGPLMAPPPAGRLVQFSGPLLPSRPPAKSTAEIAPKLSPASTASAYSPNLKPAAPAVALSPNCSSSSGKSTPPATKPSNIGELDTKPYSYARENRRAADALAVSQKKPQNKDSQLRELTRMSTANILVQAQVASYDPSPTPATLPNSCYNTVPNSAKNSLSDSEDDLTDWEADEYYDPAEIYSSRPESNSAPCQVSVLSGVVEQEQDGLSYTDPHARDFIMRRFLPAAKAISEQSEASERRSPSDTPTGSPHSRATRPLALPGRSRFANFKQELNDDDDDAVDVPNLMFKGCGFLPFQMGLKHFTPGFLRFGTKRITEYSSNRPHYVKNGIWPCVHQHGASDEDQEERRSKSASSQGSRSCPSKHSSRTNSNPGTTCSAGSQAPRMKENTTSTLVAIAAGSRHGDNRSSIAGVAHLDFSYVSRDSRYRDESQVERASRGNSGFLGVPKDRTGETLMGRDWAVITAHRSGRRDYPYDIELPRSQHECSNLPFVPQVSHLAQPATSAMDGFYRDGQWKQSTAEGLLRNQMDQQVKVSDDYDDNVVGLKHIRLTRSEEVQEGVFEDKRIMMTPFSLHRDSGRFGDRVVHDIGETGATSTNCGSASESGAEVRRNASGLNLTAIQAALSDEVDELNASGWPFGGAFVAAPGSDSKDAYLSSPSESPFNAPRPGKSPDKTSPVSVLQPPLPKSPSESWLWKVLPTATPKVCPVDASTRKCLQHSLTDVTMDSKWEALVKSDSAELKLKLAQESFLYTKGGHLL